MITLELTITTLMINTRSGATMLQRSRTPPSSCSSKASPTNPGEDQDDHEHAEDHRVDAEVAT